MTDKPPLSVEARAAAAARLLEDEVLMAVFAEIEAECVASWVATGFNASPDRERVWTFMKAVQRIKGSLEAMIVDGKLVARQMVRDPHR